MILDEQLLKKLMPNRTHAESLKRYLLNTYGQEPFPHEYSEQDLLENIRKDVMAYEKGQLDLTDEDMVQGWQVERSELQSLYSQKEAELKELTMYVDELEQILRFNGLASSRMSKKAMDKLQTEDF